MRVPTGKEILEADDRVKEPVLVPEWGEGAGVFIQSISAAERDEWEQHIAVMRMAKKGVDFDFNRTNIRAKLVVMAAVDENGKRLFSPDQARALGQKNAAVVDRLFTVAARLAGLTEEDERAIEKNLLKAPGEDLPSA